MHAFASLSCLCRINSNSAFSVPQAPQQSYGTVPPASMLRGPEGNSLSSSLEAQQLHIKDEGGVGRDHLGSHK